MAKLKMTSDPGLERRAEMVALFSCLVHARHKSLFRDAADAQDELGRLGVTVKFRRRDRRAVK